MTNVLALLQTFFEPWLVFLAEDPLLRLLQCAILFGGCFVIFLVFFTTRDILLRTQSFTYMFVCILVVALLPILGFLIYLLIRPARTIKERELEAMMRELGGKKHGESSGKKEGKGKKEQVKKEK